MKSKTINVTYRFRPSNEYGLEKMMNEYQDGEENLIALFPEEEEGRIAACYQFEDKEVNAYFYDTELWEGIREYSIHLLTEEGSVYIAYADITGMERFGNLLRVQMSFQIPWEDTRGPSVPEQEQVYTATQKEPEIQLVNSKVVGVKHHVDKEQYKELEERVNRMEKVFLVKEPDNPQDKNAIAAYTSDGRKIGYIPQEDISSIGLMMGDSERLEAELSYMEFMSSSVNIRIKNLVTTSVMAKKLFSRYTPIEVYRANYLFRKWGGISDKDETGLFSKDKQTIEMEKFSQLPIAIQDRIAEIWYERMSKANVENPTNPGTRMNVPLDLADYGTSWKELDLSNEALISLLEVESKMVAIYIRMRRNGFKGSPEEFIDEMGVNEPGETVLKRMHYIYDNNRM